MSHFAEIDKDGIVQRVIVAEQNFINSGTVGDSFNWVQTSYNSNFRKNYAGKGYLYDKVRDAFIPTKPHPSMVLNEETCQWDYLTPCPDNGKRHYWDEDTTSWKEI